MTRPLCEFQVTIHRFGQQIVKTEWSDNKDAVIEITDAINHSRDLVRKGYGAVVETRGVSSVAASQG